MIDMEARQCAADLVRRYRDGELENDPFHSRMAPLIRSEDRALRAIESMLWMVSDHSRAHRLDGVDALNEEGRALFDRCLLFLGSNSEYEWTQDRFDRTSGFIPAVHVLTLGLSWLYSRWKTSQNDRFYAAVNAAGEFDVWPFIRRTDFEEALLSATIRR
jgi:hypothetical protein